MTIAWLSLAVSVLSVVVAVFVAMQARRSADSAAASAIEARRLADATKQGVSTQEQALDIERNRVAREQLTWSEEKAPKWEPLSGGSEARFIQRGTQFSGSLRNGGLVGADVDLAVLDLPSANRIPMQQIRDSVQTDREHGPAVHISPGGVLRLVAELPEGDDLVGDARPSIYMDFHASGLIQLGTLGVTIELLREGSAQDGALAWRVGRVRPSLLA